MATTVVLSWDCTVEDVENSAEKGNGADGSVGVVVYGKDLEKSWRSQGLVYVGGRGRGCILGS